MEENCYTKDILYSSHMEPIIFLVSHCNLLCIFDGSMTYAPTTNAPARNANVEAYINPDPIPNPNPNPNPYPALNPKPNHTHESHSVFGEVSMPEQLSPEHMLCHHIIPCYATGCDLNTKKSIWGGSNRDAITGSLIFSTHYSIMPRLT